MAIRPSMRVLASRWPGISQKIKKCLRGMVTPRTAATPARLACGPAGAGLGLRPHACVKKGVYDPGKDLGAFFIRQMAGAGQHLELHSIEAAPQFLGRLQRNRPVPVTPQQQRRDLANALQCRLQPGHVVKPGFQHAEDIIHGSRERAGNRCTFPGNRPVTV